MSRDSDIYFVQYKGDMKQEGVNNLDGFILCSIMKVSITNVRDEQQRRAMREFIYRCTGQKCPALLSEGAL